MMFSLKIIPLMVRNSRTKTVALSLYLYTNEHVVIPRTKAGIFGSGFIKLQAAENTSYRHNLYVKRNREINLDKARAGRRCESNDDTMLVGRCVVSYTENANNCTTYGLMGNKTKKLCDKSAKSQGMSSLLEEEIFKLTGCVPKCVRDSISMRRAPDGYSWPARPNQQFVIIRLEYEDGSYKLTEEYEDYDMSSFIADVGGYLGLLLGYSVLSIYYIINDLMAKCGNDKFKRFVFYVRTFGRGLKSPYFTRWYKRLCGYKSHNESSYNTS